MIDWAVAVRGAVLAGALLVAAPAMAEDWLDRLAGLLGISNVPSTMRGSTEKALTGAIYIARSASDVVKVTASDDYRSPVFAAGGRELLALRGDELVRISLDSGAPQELWKLEGALKLLGVGRSDPGALALLVRGSEGEVVPAELQLSTGRLTVFVVDRGSGPQQRMIDSLLGETREFDAASLTVERLPDTTRILLAQSNGDRRIFARCEGVYCGQPALSPDWSQVAFIRERGAQ